MLGEDDIKTMLETATKLLKDMEVAHASELNTLLQKQNQLTQMIQVRANELKDLEAKQKGKIETLQDILGIKNDPNPESKAIA